MPSTARRVLDVQLKDFDELMYARDTVCPSEPGRPRQRQGAAILRSSVVLLSAAFEAYVETVFEDAVDILFSGVSEGARTELKHDTSRRLHNASVAKVNRLFFNVGIPWIMSKDRIRWQKFSNASVRTELDRIVKARNGIAHGASPPIRKSTAIRWKGVIERLADRLDIVVADHLEQQTEERPW